MGLRIADFRFRLVSMPVIKHHKPINLYTHPAITEYEFLRMKPVRSLAKIFGICLGITFAVIGVVVVLALVNDKPKEVKEYKHKIHSSGSRWQPEEGMTGSLDRVEYTKRVE